MALFIPGSESLSPVSNFEKLSHTSSLAWSSISLPCDRADDTEWGTKKPHRILVITEQEKDRFCSQSSCFSDTLKVTLAGLNYLFHDVMSSNEKDVEGKNNEFLSLNLYGGAKRRKNLRGWHAHRTSFETATARIWSIPDCAQMIMPYTEWHATTSVVDFHNCTYIIVRYF